MNKRYIIFFLLNCFAAILGFYLGYIYLPIVHSLLVIYYMYKLEVFNKCTHDYYYANAGVPSKGKRMVMECGTCGKIKIEVSK